MSDLSFNNLRLGVCFTGSYCTYSRIFSELKILKKLGADMLPILSLNVTKTDSRFGRSTDFLEKITDITGKKPLTTIPATEPIGPKHMVDAMLVAPCTGNTLAKMANGITDTPVLMAIKSHLRNNLPVIIFLSTNDALGMNLKNLGILLNTKNIYFVPFGQDNYNDKPNSLVSHEELIYSTIIHALKGKQLQPVIQGYEKEIVREDITKTCVE